MNVMQLPLEIAYHGVGKNERVDKIIRKRAAALEEVCNYLIICRVTVEKPHAHQDCGNPYRLRPLVRVSPGRELVVKRKPYRNPVRLGQPSLSALVVGLFDRCALRTLLSVFTDRQIDLP